MKFEQIHDLVGDIPFIAEDNARYLYGLIIREKFDSILELGIGHGTATCYMAAALHELQRGKVTAVDLLEPDEAFSPCAEELVSRCGLEEYVKIVRTKTGYNWFLHDAIARQTKKNVCEECYDLCIIDGPKNWTIDGAAFFFVNKLLKKGGRIIFDDYNWTYADADARRDTTDGITHRKLSEAERTIPHIKEVVDLLVMQHPSYGKITMLDGSDWVIAEKVQSSQKVVEFTRTFTWKEVLYRGVAWLTKRSGRPSQPILDQGSGGATPASTRAIHSPSQKTARPIPQSKSMPLPSEEATKRRTA